MPSVIVLLLSNKGEPKKGITDYELKEVVGKLEAGQADANLGGDVYKVRIARSGEGKSGGYRVVVLFKKEESLSENPSLSIHRPKYPFGRISTI
jgi:hypothetical protein